VEAAGDLDELSELEVEPIAADVINARLAAVAAIAVTLAQEEANRQGVTIPRPDTEDIADLLRTRAEAVDEMLARDLAMSASREATRLTGGSITPGEVADKVTEHLRGLKGAAASDHLGGAVQTSINDARKLTFNRDGREGDIFSSELLDSNTCSACIAVDGTHYQDVEAAAADYPTGGFIGCEGRERCRGTLIKVYRSETPSTLQTPFGE
jgi:hypothetical protein